jgi:hypothetical protein
MQYVTDIKSLCKGISDTFSYMIGIDNVTLEMKSDVVWYTTVGCKVITKEIHLTDKASFFKVNISHLGCWSAHYYVLQDTTSATLFREAISLNYWNLIRIIRAIFKKTTFLFWSSSEGPKFLDTPMNTEQE